jgi:hypothetical protein
MMEYLFLYPVRFLTLAAAFLLLAGIPLRSRWMRALVLTVAGLGIASYVVTVVRDEMGDSVRAFDLEYFWIGGQNLREGRSPYDDPNVMNPPVAFPLYWLVSAVPFEEGRLAWTMLIGLGALALVEFARRILTAGGDDTARKLGLPVILLLTAVLCLSRANRFGIELGQLALPVTLCLFWAFYAHLRNRPNQTGIGLAVASIKTPTLIPLLLYFVRRFRWRMWVTMGAAGVALVLVTTSPGQIVPRCQECLRNIAGTREQGKLDDYDISNSRNYSMMSFSVLFNRLGMLDRGKVEMLSLAATAVVTACVACLLLGRRRLDTPAALSVVSIYAMLFLYHRIYDLILLAVPLVYVYGKARQERGKARWLFVACGVCMLLALNIREWLVADTRVRVLAVDDLTSSLLRVVVLPYLTWLMVLALVFLVLAEHARPKIRGATLRVLASGGLQRYTASVGRRPQQTPIAVLSEPEA